MKREQYVERTKTKYTITTSEVKEDADKYSWTETRSEICYGQKKFLRVDTALLFRTLAPASHSGAKIALFILSNVRYADNICYMTSKKMAQNVHLSQNAVDKALMELTAADFCRNAGHGEWMLNPAIAFGDYEQNRQDCMDAYLSLAGRKKKGAKNNVISESVTDSEEQSDSPFD